MFGLGQNITAECVKSLVISVSNKYVKISEAKFREIVKYFTFDLDPQTGGDLSRHGFLYPTDYFMSDRVQ